MLPEPHGSRKPRDGSLRPFESRKFGFEEVIQRMSDELGVSRVGNLPYCRFLKRLEKVIPQKHLQFCIVPRRTKGIAQRAAGMTTAPRISPAIMLLFDL
jgi:hypothetical protein